MYDLKIEYLCRVGFSMETRFSSHTVGARDLWTAQKAKGTKASHRHSLSSVHWQSSSKASKLQQKILSFCFYILKRGILIYELSSVSPSRNFLLLASFHLNRINEASWPGKLGGGELFWICEVEVKERPWNFNDKILLSPLFFLWKSRIIIEIVLRAYARRECSNVEQISLWNWSISMIMDWNCHKNSYFELFVAPGTEEINFQCGLIIIIS